MPFDSIFPQNIIKNTMKGDYKMEGLPWKNISNNGIKFIFYNNFYKY